MSEAKAQPDSGPQTGKNLGMAVVAWLLTAIYYFYQYSLRSAPSVMMPQLSEAFGVSTLGVASIVGLFYYGYSPFSLIAGAAMDQLGPRRVIPVAATVGIMVPVARKAASSANPVHGLDWGAHCHSPRNS